MGLAFSSLSLAGSCAACKNRRGTSFRSFLSDFALTTCSFFVPCGMTKSITGGFYFLNESFSGAATKLTAKKIRILGQLFWAIFVAAQNPIGVLAHFLWQFLLLPQNPIGVLANFLWQFFVAAPKPNRSSGPHFFFVADSKK